jgi:hypothetical protein
MKNRYAFLFVLLCSFFPCANHLLGQCTNQVMHTSGSALVAGVNVTVTSTGNTCAWTTYCPAVTQPFFIGYNPGLGSGPGSFTFTFSPPINGIRLNISGASNTAPSIEEVRLHINGAHYAMAAPGSANACDPMAVLTPAGDLQGCPGCGVSGWANTNITGFPISTLTVEDFVLGGAPNGSLFSLWICPGVLPAEWVDFKAQETAAHTVDLDWTTVAEINNDYFTVERSVDGIMWEALANVDAVGNSRSEESYSFVDLKPHMGMNQYRISQTSLDGSSSLSQVEMVEISSLPGLRISPNPAHDHLWIEMADLDRATVTLRNQLGQEVGVMREVMGDRMTLNTRDLARGVYFVEVKTAERILTEKIVLE